MRERVEELGRGHFRSNAPKIEISTSLIEINLTVDETYEGCFSLKSLNSNKMRGNVYTSTYRMQCINSQFIGNEATILFRFDAKGICEGKNIKGKFYIISNGGEISLPFVVHITKKEIHSSIGKINNLFQFTNLATSNWSEAFEVFQMPSFKNVFINHDKKHENLYLALTCGEHITEQCMEEFLVGIHKKSPVFIQMNETRKSIYEFKNDEKESILLSKNTWGYVNTKVTCDCDFIELSKSVITTNDFIGSTFHLDYVIIKEKLHAGINYGKICIRSINSEISYEIEISREKEKVGEQKSVLEKERNLAQLTKLYISYRCKKTNIAPWVKECMGYIYALQKEEPDNIQYQLLKIQLLFIQKKNHEAHSQLQKLKDTIQEWKEDSRLYAYYLYLTAFANREISYREKVTKEIREIYQKQKHWQILWVMLYLDTKLQEDLSKRFDVIERQFFLHGCSPILYVEAYRIIRTDPFMVQKLGNFEIQVLLWAVKNQVLSREIALQVAGLITKIKVFQPLLFQILTYSYKEYPEKEILSAICRLLIHGNKTGEAYFEWYRQGVEQEIRITRLYEYYMYSIPMNFKGTIPKTVLMYFGYFNNLDYKKSALLYERVIKQRDIYPELFQSYRRFMEEFMLEQLMRKRNNEQLAFVYDTLLSLNHVTLELAEAISEIVFGYELYCKNTNIKSVAVVHKHLRDEKIYEVIEERAHIQLFTKDYAISFLDQEENRYFGSVDYQIKSLMDEDYYIKKCFELNVTNKNVRFNIGQKLLESNLLEEDKLELITELLVDDEIKEEFKLSLKGKIIEYCYSQEEEKFTKYMTDMDLESLDCQKRFRVIEYFILRGLYQNAYEAISQYGYQDISTKQLMKFTSTLIEEHSFEKQELFLSLAVYVFEEKKYNDTILTYLVLHYNATISKMRDIWKIAYKFEIDTYELAERIILQALFTNEYLEDIDDIFDYYYKCGAKSQIAQAFLTYYAYLFVVEDKKIEAKTFAYIQREEYIEDVINDTCKLAMLKHYATYETLSTKEQEYVETTLEEFMCRKIYFKFYEQFGEKILQEYGYEGKHLVEYKSQSKQDVWIHYIQTDGNGEGEYKIEKMEQSYPGLYHKVFTIFYGEKVEYYIVEENNHKDLFKNDILMKNGMNFINMNSRYNLLNDMSVAAQMHDDATLLELMKRYAQNSQITKQLFDSM